VGRAKHWSLYTLKPAPGYLAAVAIEGTGARLRQRTWSMPSLEAAVPGGRGAAAAQGSGNADVTEPDLRERSEISLDV
jgi:hypothetical protein